MENSEAYNHGFNNYIDNGDSNEFAKVFRKIYDIDYLKTWPGDALPQEWKEFNRGWEDKQSLIKAKELYESCPTLVKFAEYCLDNNIRFDFGCGCCTNDSQIQIGEYGFDHADLKLVVNNWEQIQKG